MKTLVGLFDSYADAIRAIEMLQNQGFDKRKIGVVAREQLLRDHLAGRRSPVAEDASAGAISGATLGGLLGALVGMGTLAIPGVGAVLAVGTLAATLGTAAAGAGVGAATGGLIGALVGAGVPNEDVLFYAEGMRRGGVLVTLHTEDDRVLEALNTLRQARMVDVEQRREAWRRDGWDERETDARPLGEPIEPIAVAETQSHPDERSEASGEVNQPTPPPESEPLETHEVLTEQDQKVHEQLTRN